MPVETPESLRATRFGGRDETSWRTGFRELRGELARLERCESDWASRCSESPAGRVSVPYTCRRTDEFALDSRAHCASLEARVARAVSRAESDLLSLELEAAHEEVPRDWWQQGDPPAEELEEER